MTLRERRQALGFSVEDLARLTGLSHLNVWAVDTEEGYPSPVRHRVEQALSHYEDMARVA